MLMSINFVLSQTVNYNHPSEVGLIEKDCFDSFNNVCLSRDLVGPIINIGILGDDGLKWGCGSCNSVKKWFNGFSNEFRDECFAGNMPSIVNKNICLDSGSNAKWDIVFSYFQSGGGGGFSYIRTSYSKDSKKDSNIIQGNAISNTNDQLNYTIIIVVLIAAIVLLVFFFVLLKYKTKINFYKNIYKE
jgi:hypothetical protein